MAAIVQLFYKIATAENIFPMNMKDHISFDWKAMWKVHQISTNNSQPNPILGYIKRTICFFMLLHHVKCINFTMNAVSTMSHQLWINVYISSLMKNVRYVWTKHLWKCRMKKVMVEKTAKTLWLNFDIFIIFATFALHELSKNLLIAFEKRSQSARGKKHREKKQKRKMNSY